MSITTSAPRAPAAVHAREFMFEKRDFERVRKLIYARAGISLHEGKQNMVYSRLARRLRQTGTPDFCSYLDWLEANPHDSVEWQEFVNALTTNLTAFWREAHHFPVLAKHVAERARHGPVKLWCCAASTGEEPYTMAITALEAGASRTPPVSILATDINTEVIATARKGVYRASDVEEVSPALLKKYFLRGRGSNGGLVRVRPEVQSLLHFSTLNLLQERWPIQERFDAIFCRNVMIYFDKATQLRVLRALARHLKPDGLLFAGHSENFSQAADFLQLLRHTVYRPRPG